jgi:hypothetical protein
MKGVFEAPSYDELLNAILRVRLANVQQSAAQLPSA